MNTLEKIVEEIINYFKSLDLCKFGVHKWRTIETQNKYFLWLSYGDRKFSSEGSVLTSLDNRVCLRCKKVDLQIDNYKEKLKITIEENKKLHEYAKQIVKERQNG